MSLGEGNKERIANYRSVALKDFKEGDTYYVQKLYGGFNYSALCKFVKLERGVVHGVVVENYVPRGHRVPDEMEAGSTIKARVKKCYLWGK